MKTARAVKTLLMLLVLAFGLLGFTPVQRAAVEYVKVCSLYGAGFHYIPGTDICLNDSTGDAREETGGGTWRSLLPYPAGKWVTNLDQACGSGRLVHVGTYRSTDFTINPYNRLQTAPFSLKVNLDEMISKVIMSGGFYDPRIPNRHGANDTDGLCLRSVDPTVLEFSGNGPVNPTYGNGNLPLGCVANSRLVNMPAAYAIAATSAYPDIDSYFTDGTQTAVAGPYVYGSQLVVTTDLGPGGPTVLQYMDAVSGLYQPMAGKLSVSVCVDGSNDFGGR